MVFSVFLFMPHIHEMIDFTAEVFIVFENKVLLRKHDKYHMWMSVGGHIELNEDPNEAALREVKEEVGLDVELFGTVSQCYGGKEYRELIPPISMNRHRISPTHEHISLVFFARADTDVLKLSETEKTDACHWFTKDELLSYDLYESVRQSALDALELLSNT